MTTETKAPAFLCSMCGPGGYFPCGHAFGLADPKAKDCRTCRSAMRHTKRTERHAGSHSDEYTCINANCGATLTTWNED
jgi:hypothetical protein